VQVLFITGHDDYNAIQRAYEAGANDFIANLPIPCC